MSTPLVQAEPLGGQQNHDQTVFPQFRHCQANATLADTVNWAERCRDELLEDAATHGAILFRGLPLKTAEDFDAFIAAFRLPNFRYQESLSNAVRVNRTERVFTANEAPADVTIYLHHEMAQTPIYPSRLFFFCEQAAETGGATPLCRSDVLFQKLLVQTPDFANDCREKGLLYRNVMPPTDDPQSGMGRSWRSTFSAKDKAEAEEKMRGLQYSWEWLEDDCLRATTPVLPAVRQLPDGRETFFNQLIAAFRGWRDSRNDPSKSILFGDESPLPAAEVQSAADIAESLTFDVPWQAGDVALVDNFVTMHGRRAFSGRRKVLASLIA